MERILIIEDERDIAKVLTIELEYEGYEVDAAYDGKAGLDKARDKRFDLILLDVMLPVFSGMEVLRRLRREDQQTPVILLTARNTTMDKVTGLDQGANDYVTKPFEIEELLARIRSCIRTNPIRQPQELDKHLLLTAGDIEVHPGTREVLKNGQLIQLTPKEFDLLTYLISHKNTIVTREGILANVWGYDFEGETNVIDVYIRHLRIKLLEDPALPLIHTVRGVGYVIKEK